jgi:SpoVK/Ycf46/Vps4 family AAA+-type ATPase
MARLSLSGNKEDIVLFLKRLNRKLDNDGNSLADKIKKLYSPTADSVLRNKFLKNIPFDKDNRLNLIQYHEPAPLPSEPIFEASIQASLQQIILEQEKRKQLEMQNVTLSKSLLFFGPPGVGKTLSAKWLAWQLDVPLLVLDLSAVMSSFLGRTGNNIKTVFEYAKKFRCILLLDELDAIAKKRDDFGEVGELKRLVTVLLQEIDSWPDENLLIAATNHPDLLDPAIWRRFDLLVNFPLPKLLHQVKNAIDLFFQGTLESELYKEILSYLFINKPYSEIERFCLQTKRKAIIHERSIESLILEFLEISSKEQTTSTKKEIAKRLLHNGLSQRKTSQISGLSRVTIQKLVREG